jgi:cyclopropane-fatty-acyl-phospholipid synthase
MQVLSNIIPLAERAGIPDGLARLAIGMMVARTDRSLSEKQNGETAKFVQAMSDMPIAVHASDANAQHYELPPEFFALVLGPRCKYSCCYYPSETTTLAEAEVASLEETARRADIRDGQSILDLGCGWGSFALFAAERFPNSKVTAVSNSRTQKAHIDREIADLGLTNISVRTADMNSFEAAGSFDRVVSIEMFEHMSNWPRLLARIRSWLKSDGRLFVHVFSHKSTPYRFELDNKRDWIAQHFFTGGIMPSHDLIGACRGSFRVEQDWQWSGEHYARTARHWLENFSANSAEIDRILRDVYGDEARLWRQRWRLFFLATEGLFGHDGGSAWGVSHYRLAPVALRL